MSEYIIEEKIRCRRCRSSAVVFRKNVFGYNLEECLRCKFTYISNRMKIRKLIKIEVPEEKLCFVGCVCASCYPEDYR